MEDFCKLHSLSEDKKAKLQMVVDEQLKIYYHKKKRNNSMYTSGKAWNINKGELTQIEEETY